MQQTTFYRRHSANSEVRKRERIRTAELFAHNVYSMRLYRFLSPAGFPASFPCPYSRRFELFRYLASRLEHLSGLCFRRYGSRKSRGGLAHWPSQACASMAEAK
jgi:hypothetical protein